MICDAVISAMGRSECENTPDGARIFTHCLHPTFDPVAVYVQAHMDGYFVHDGGEAFDLAWLENRSEKALSRFMKEHSVRFGVDFDDHRIFGRALSPEWLPSVILGVANAAAAATGALLAAEPRLSDAEDADLREQTYILLKDAFTDKRVPRRIERRGRTGKKFKFAFGITQGEHMALVDTVTPNPISISSRYTAFSAVSAREYGGAFVVHNRPLPIEDSGLLAEVVDVVPIEALIGRVERELVARTALLS